MLDILIISFIWTFIIDLTDIMDFIKRKIWKYAFGSRPYQPFSMKPFDCPLCLSWWSGILYLILTHSFSFPSLGFVALVSFLTTVEKDLLLLIRDILVKIISLIYSILE